MFRYLLRTHYVSFIYLLGIFMGSLQTGSLIQEAALNLLYQTILIIAIIISLTIIDKKNGRF